MPHLELRFSSDLDVDADKILRDVEACILRHDAGAGDCKGRAYPCEFFYHTHLKAEVSLLAKPHRDAAFVAALQKDITALLAAALPRPCWLSVDITFSGFGYHTEHLT